MKKKEKRIKSVIIGFSVLIIFSVVLHIFPTYDSNFSSNEDLLNQPKLSDGEITIITPENKTYNQAMDGNYPGTYSFDEDYVGENPNNWVVDENGGSCNVIAEIDGHNKVIELYDTSGSDFPSALNYFDNNKATGTVEWWWYSDSNTDLVQFLITDEDNYAHVNILTSYTSTTYIQYYDGTLHNIAHYFPDTWYHMEVQFDVAGQWYLWINGAQYGPYNYQGTPQGMDCFYAGMDYNPSNYYCYIDAVGYSWDSNYELGSNFNEGVVIGYENSTNLDWTGYSFDNENNITISGNKTIPIPNKGLHSVQVFGNDSFGTMYQSEKRYFTIEPLPLNIITPENKTYTEMMFGYYPATFGFEDDKVGAKGTEISFVEDIGANGRAEVVEEKENHKRVLNYSLLADFEQIAHFFGCRVKGTVEFWIYYENTIGSEIYLKSEEGMLYISPYAGSLRVYDGAWHTIGSYSTNTWYHYAITWDCSIGNWNLRIDGEFIGTFNFHKSPSYLVYISFDGYSGANFYLDAIGYSWDSNYELDNNLNEGLLLSFTNDTSFGYIEYSFDDQEQKRILGNTTIPIPEDGQHTIKIFARDIESYFYESDKRYYSIDIAPFVKWQSPNEGTEVIFPPGDAVFNFLYSYRELNNVTLEINGTDFGSVWNKTAIILNPYTEDIDGYVNVTLYGFEEGNPIPITSDTINITLAKVNETINELLDAGNEFIGKKLYLILHDPPGDNSFSGFEETTSITIGTSSSFKTSVGVGLGISAKNDLFDVGMEASANIKGTWSTQSDYSLQVIDAKELLSSQESSNKDYIGPGYGDRYWGEAITYSWELRAQYKEYYNGTKRYEEPMLYWGLQRSSEVILNDYNAPENWRELNPVHNNWSNIEWKGNYSIDGGSPFPFSHTTKESRKRTDSFQLEIDASVTAKLGPISLTFSLELDWQNQEEHGEEEEFKTHFTIHDDESTDHISFQYGIDELFSTYIFRSYSDTCKTSQPLEYNTFDYVPPNIEFPEIKLDSSQDGLAPCMDDSPIITTEISDEGGIQVAWVNYSIDNGDTWLHINLSEQIANPGNWQASIPSFEHGTKILWYVVAWDMVGSKTTRKDSNGNPYVYTVINRQPEITLKSPNGGEVFKNIITIEWTPFDPDGDSLIYALAYNDGGIGWHLIESNLIENSYLWNVSTFSYSDSILIKVIAYDGYGGSSEDISDFLFTIDGPKPDESEVSKPSSFEFPLFEILSIVSIGIAVFTAAVVLRKSRLSSK